jgi:hypothetical protein
MSVTALPRSVVDSQGHFQEQTDAGETDWTRIAVGGTLLAGAFLLLTGRRRAGLVVTAAATAMTLLEEKETVRAWWNSLPQYLDEAQLLLNQAQRTVDDLAAKRDKLRAMFDR